MARAAWHRAAEEPQREGAWVRMQMHDAVRYMQGGAAASDLAVAFDVTPAAAEVVMRVVGRELTWHLEKNTISCAGLADLVEALGSGHHVKYLDGRDVFRDQAACADGNAILGHILGSKERSRAVAARAARQAGLEQEVVRSMLPGLAAVIMGRLAGRANGSLGEVLGVVPPLGRWGRGEPHADLADILRRGCGAGPYARGKLRRVVRGVLARAGGFTPRGAVRWYMHFMLRPVMTRGQSIASRLLPRG
jgi:hypothetical protein